MDENEKIYYNAFNLIEDIGPVRIFKLKKFFKKLSDAWNCGKLSEFRNAGFEEKILEKIFHKKQGIDPEKEFIKLEKEKIKTITIEEKLYPKLLKEIYPAPQILYFRGTLTKQDDFSIAIVGTRKLSPYGKLTTLELSRELASQRITIVSGLAIGIDALAHKAALDANGRTIAVLGSGVGRNDIYPRANYGLAEEIIKNGAILSEYPLGMPAVKQHFPARNRIISGLSLGTLVTEAGKKSGALITAFLALEQNREVFAVPGNINSRKSDGPNMLIKKGAKPVTCVDDIFEELNLENVKGKQEAKKILPETKEEESLLKALSKEPTHRDKLADLTKLDASIISSTLSIMELKGIVQQVGAGNYILNT
ncbi:MAG: hypothetical protein ACD_63C00213G0001 [uncultured bacterium]|nr:MAG: hypothetical protein ACD_63C00213G0001 [uncultured bacterium]